jgi:hypothetical protein
MATTGQTRDLGLADERRIRPSPRRASQRRFLRRGQRRRPHGRPIYLPHFFPPHPRDPAPVGICRGRIKTYFRCRPPKWPILLLIAAYAGEFTPEGSGDRFGGSSRRRCLMPEFEVHLLDTRHLAVFADAAGVSAEAERDQVGTKHVTGSSSGPVGGVGQLGGRHATETRQG